MLEIEVGEYLRTKDGHIAKYIEKLTKDEDVSDGMLFDSFIYGKYKNIRYSFLKEIMVKHSKQLIDLIEVGDIVNKLEITSFTEKDKEHKERIVWHNTFYGDDDIAITNNEIKTILTKEIYMANCYKVGGEE